jgi:hypothetical protein
MLIIGTQVRNYSRLLYKCSTGTCGTVKQNRSGFPKFQGTLQRGEQSVQHNANMVAIKWHDKRDVYVLSTVHDSSLIAVEKRKSNSSKEILIPLCIKEYNENRGIINKTAINMKFSESIRKTRKWYKELFSHIMDLSVLNSHILFKNMKHQNFQLSKFKLEIIRNLISKYGSKRSHIGRLLSVYPLRLTARHFPSLIPPNESNQSPRRRYYVCSNTERRAKERSDTRYQCTECDVGLCITDCFKDFHALQRISRYLV